MWQPAIIVYSALVALISVPPALTWFNYHIPNIKSVSYKNLEATHHAYDTEMNEKGI